MKSIKLAMGLAVAFLPATIIFAQAAAKPVIESVDVIQASATVEKIDMQHRKVTLLFEDGKHKTVTVDKSVQNLDQVKVGDKLKMTYTDEFVVSVNKTGETPSATSAGVVSLAPKGAKPGGYEVSTETLSGKVLNVDVPKYKVTLQMPNGKKKTINVSKSVTNLSQLQVGDSIDMSYTEAVAISIEK
jgi:Cu/Ag efflux protein CusF